MDPWIHGSAAGAAARAAARAAAGAAADAAASAAAVCIYYVLGALTLGQRIKCDLASHGKNRGSRAGEHEQPNAGRKRKRHVFFFVAFLLVERCRTREGKAQRAMPERAKIESERRPWRPRGLPRTTQNRGPGAPKCV